MNPRTINPNNVPTPRRALEELPDQATVDANGIDLDVTTARLVLCVISRQAGRGRSKTRTLLHETTMGLVFMARMPLERNGEIEPAPFPTLPDCRWPQGREVLTRLGINHRELEAYWAKARRQADDAAFPLPWALAFFPAAVWPMIAKVIAWGPEQVHLRMQAAVAAMAETTTKVNRRRRPAGSPLSRATIDNRVTGVWQLLDVLLELRSIATMSPVLPLAMLDAWTVKPPRIDPGEHGARDADQDNSGPALEACSTRLKQLAADARKAPDRASYLKRRQALLLALLCMYGGRADSFRILRVDDYQPKHRFRDGDTGAALRLYPGKTWEPEQAHYLPLPAELAEWVERWIVSTDRQVGQPDQPLFPNRKPKPGRAATEMTAHGFSTAIAGASQKSGTGSYALLAMDTNPYIGWRTHAYRHTAYQLAIRAATNLQHADPTFFRHVHPREFAAAVVGHKLVTDVSAIYRDLDRQRLSRAAVDEMWRLLFDDGVLRRGADPTRVRRARENYDAVRITITSVADHIRDLDAKATQAGARADSARDEARRLQFRLEAAQYRLEAHAQRDELRHFEAGLEEANAEFETAKTTLVPIPDHLTDSEHSRLLAEALADPTNPSPAVSPAPLADDLPVDDVAHLFGTTPQTINRWHREGQPPTQPPRWVGDDAWHIYTAKHKRLRIRAINHAALTREQNELLELIRKERARIDQTPARAAPSPPNDVGEGGGQSSTELGLTDATNDATSNGAPLIGGQLDAWETSGSSPPAPTEPHDCSEGTLS